MTAASEPKPRIFPSAPFLVWPVSRREFYRALCVSMMLPVVWGIVIYGVRPLMMLLSAVGAATVTHALLKRVLHWKKAQPLLFVHSMMAAVLLVALALPSWPIWPVAVMAAIFPLLFAFVGGPGRERVHLAIAAVLIIQYILLPALAGHTYNGKPDAVLARDRLFMGDIRDQHSAPSSEWPVSRDLAGNDAFPMPQPGVIAANTLNQISTILIVESADKSGLLRDQSNADIDRTITHALSADLPSMDLFMLGVSPNRIGAASLIAIIVAGLFLAYRYILRPRSFLLYVVVYIVATVAMTFTPRAIGFAGIPTLWHTFLTFKKEFITLMEYVILSGDAPFAAVFILALPGTEPLSARGRRIFIVLAALFSAALHRMDPSIPAASLILCLLMPLAPLFDRTFGTRSWLNAK